MWLAFVAGPILVLSVDVFLKRIAKCQLTTRLKQIRQSVSKNQSHRRLSLSRHVFKKNQVGQSSLVSRTWLCQLAKLNKAVCFLFYFVFDFFFLFLIWKYQARHWVSPLRDSPFKANKKAWNEHRHQAGDLVLGWKRHCTVFHCWCFSWREILCREKTSSEMSPLPNFKRRKPLWSINRLNRVFVMTTNYLLQKQRG